MKATLVYNLPDEQPEFEMAINGAKMQLVLWEMDQWLRSKYKYMPDEEYSKDKYETYEKCREQLRDLLREAGVNIDA